jgi:hypothetical protein
VRWLFKLCQRESGDGRAESQTHRSMRSRRQQLQQRSLHGRIQRNQQKLCSREQWAIPKRFVEREGSGQEVLVRGEGRQ